MEKYALWILNVMLIFCSYAVKGIAQEPDTADRHFMNATLNGSMNRTADGLVYMSNNTFSYSYRQDMMVLNTRAQFVFGQSLGKVTNRDYTAGLDGNWYLRKDKKWYVWALGNGLSSYSLKINHQVQAGGGFAYNVWNSDKLWLNISDGLLFEQSEIIDAEGGLLNYSTLRNSLRINFGFSFEKKFFFKTVSFWQPSLHIAGDYIINSHTEFRYQLFDWLQISTNLNYNKVSRTEKENLLFTYGVRLSYSF